MERRPVYGWKSLLGACLLAFAGMTAGAAAQTAPQTTAPQTVHKPASETGLQTAALQTAQPQAAAPAGIRLDGTPRIAVISAFAPELALLRKSLQEPEEHTVNGVVFTTGVLQGHPVLLFLSGISMVNAAMNTQLAIDRFNVSHILFSGIAGGVNPELNIGDVNVPERWGQHLEVLMAREPEPGVYEQPPSKENLDLPNFGMLHHRAVRVPSDADPRPSRQFWFPVDPALLEAVRGMKDITLQSCDENKVCLREPPRLVVGGNGLSGAAFVDNAQYREHLSGVFRAQVVDMESAACAMVAQANQVPFLAFRSVSDLAGGGPDANEMYIFLNIAAENSARVLMAFLAHWEHPRSDGAGGEQPAGAQRHN